MFRRSMRHAPQPEPLVLRTMRRLLLWLLTIGMVGTAADLLLLEHYETAWQSAPLVLTVIALVVVAWVAVGDSVAAVLLLRVVMAGFVAAGCVGIALHYRGNSEFQREIDPALAGWDLVTRVMTAKAPPALAPASMVQLGLLGLLSTYRHPSIRTPAASADHRSTS